MVPVLLARDLMRQMYLGCQTLRSSGGSLYHHLLAAVPTGVFISCDEHISITYVSIQVLSVPE